MKVSKKTTWLKKNGLSNKPREKKELPTEEKDQREEKEKKELSDQKEEKMRVEEKTEEKIEEEKELGAEETDVYITVIHNIWKLIR